MVRVSVIVPTYNRAELLKNTLIGLEKQSFSKNQMEVIVVDDGSSDNTSQIIDTYKNRLNLKYYFQEDKGFRVAKARNVGIKNSEGEICIFLDSGIVVGKDFVNEHIKYHKGDTDVVIGYVYGFDQVGSYKDIVLENLNMENIDESISVLKELRVKDLREYLYSKHGDNIKSWPAPWIVCWGGNFSVKKEFIVKCGNYDENYNSWGGEDIDLGLALFLQGAKYHLNRFAESIDYPHEKLNNYKENINLAYESSIRKNIYLHSKYNNFQTHAINFIDQFALNEYLIEVEKYIKC